MRLREVAMLGAATVALATAGCGSSSNDDSSGGSASTSDAKPTGPFKMVTILPTTGPLASVTAKATDGPFAYLDSKWTITPEGEGSRIRFDIDFKISNPLIAAVAEPAFAAKQDEIIDAFEDEADRRFG